MKYIKSIAASLVVASSLMMVSCDPSDFGDINDTPNAPVSSTTFALFQGAQKYVRNFVMTSSSYDPWPAEWSGYLAEGKNNQYGGLDVTFQFAAGSYYYYPIKNLTKIIELNTNPETKGSAAVVSFGSNADQIGAATTLRAFYYMTISDILGPIVYDEALQGDQDNWTPKYTTQKEVYAALDQELQEAYNMMDEKGSLNSHDIYFGGQVSKWKKFNASVREMLAIKLADVAPEDGKARFAKAYADGAMETYTDNLNYTFDSSAYSWLYAVGNPNTGYTHYFGPNAIFVNALKEYKDPRLFTYCTLGNHPSNPNDFNYFGGNSGDQFNFDDYRGIRFGMSSNSAVSAEINGAACVAQKYCEPTATYGIISAARIKLIEAEAAVLGWIDADASKLYEEGIKASFDFEASTDVYFDATQVDDYIAAHPLPAEKDAALKEIVMQRFLAGFMMDGIESWSDWRRYNIPDMPIYPSVAAGGVTCYPQRLGFADNDYNTNKANLDAALKDISGEDNPWSRVWWDVKDNTCPQLEE